MAKGGGRNRAADVPTGFLNNSTHQRIAASPPVSCLKRTVSTLVVGSSASHKPRNEWRAWTAENAAATHKITHHHPRPTFYPQAPSTKSTVQAPSRGSSRKIEHPNYGHAQNHSPSFQQYYSPTDGHFPRSPLPDNGLRERQQTSTKMLTISPCVQNHSPDTGKLLTVKKDFHSPSANKSSHLKHKSAHLRDAKRLFLRSLLILCSSSVGFRFQKN